MFFCITFGTQPFSWGIKGYEDMTLLCSNCHNPSAVPRTRANFFTLCFLPIFPLSWKKVIACDKCRLRVRTSIEQLEKIKQQGPIQMAPQGPPHPGYNTPHAAYAPQQHGYAPQQQYGYVSPPPPQYQMK